jgi:hypothetical protein
MSRARARQTEADTDFNPSEFDPTPPETSTATDPAPQQSHADGLAPSAGHAAGMEKKRKQAGPGRPGPDTPYSTVTSKSYTIRAEENQEVLALAQRCDGIFPLMTNDKRLSLQQALKKYK